MANWQKIESYALVWGFKENKGKIRMFFSDGNEDAEFDSPSELAAVADILRNEDGAYFDLETKSLRTGLEIPGEII